MFSINKLCKPPRPAAGIFPQSELDDAKAALPDHVFRELYLCEPSDDGGKRIKYSMRHITEFFGEMTVDEACHPARMEMFVQEMKGKGFRPSYINNLLGIIKAATTRAWKRRELASAPFVQLIDGSAQSAKGRPLKPSEMASLFASGSPNIRMMIMLMAGTGCPPQAAMDLTWEQVDFEAGLIHLNPQGRAQTKKFRPVVKLPHTLKLWLMEHRKQSGLIISHHGRVIRRWETAWRNTRKRAGILDASVTGWLATSGQAGCIWMRSVSSWATAALGSRLPRFTRRTTRRIS